MDTNLRTCLWRSFIEDRGRMPSDALSKIWAALFSICGPRINTKKKRHLAEVPLTLCFLTVSKALFLASCLHHYERTDLYLLKLLFVGYFVSAMSKKKNWCVCFGYLYQKSVGCSYIGSVLILQFFWFLIPFLHKWQVGFLVEWSQVVCGK